MEAVDLGKFARGAKIRSPYEFVGAVNFRSLRYYSYRFLVFDFFLSLFDCLLDLSPCNRYCFGYFGIL